MANIVNEDKIAKSWDEVIESVDNDIEVAKGFIITNTNLYDRFVSEEDVDKVIKLQAVILQYRDYIAQKRGQRAQLMEQRQEYLDSKNA